MGKPARSLGGRAPPPPPTYRDDAGDDDALSMHTTASNYDYDDVPQLPSYSDSEDAANQPHQTIVDPSPIAPRGAAHEDRYRALTYPQFKRRDNHVSPAAAVGSDTSYRMEESLLDPDELHDYVTKYLRHVPPRQLVRLQGSHWERRRQANGKNEKERVFDFDIVFNLQNWLPTSTQPGFCHADVITNSSKAFRGGWRAVRAPGATQDIEVGNDASGHCPDLKEWCHDFCGSKAWLRIFRVSRRVSGFETAAIRSRLEELARSTHYRGHVEVSCPVMDRHVDIYSPHWINRLRVNWWVRAFCYITFLWLITWPILFFMTKRWGVYEVDWRFSVQESVADAGGGDEAGRYRRRYAVGSESAWLRQHENLIVSLVNERFQGDATAMRTDVDPRRPPNAGAPATGNRNVDAAVNFIQGGVSVWNTLNGRGSNSGGGWGGDEI